MRHEIQRPGGGTITLDDGVLDRGELAENPSLPRRCYAATHVVFRASYAEVPHSIDAPGSPEEIAEHIDWDATRAVRVRADGLGMGVAESMDTAQRFEIGWAGARELLRRTGELDLSNGFVGGASSDHRESIESVDDLAEAILEQVAFVAEQGGLPIVLPQPWMPANGMGEEDYVRLYTRIADGAPTEILIHWLGEAFHPGMRGYFPGNSVDRILDHDPAKIRGIKLSLLDAEYERSMRARIGPRGQVILTGDDYNFARLMEGESQESRPLQPLGGRSLAGGAFSHALLGILGATVRPASLALQRLGRGDIEGYRALMEPCEELGRAIFEAPVQRYKSGIAFLAWLNGQQENRMLANHEENARDADHYLRVAELASRAGVLEDAALAAERLDAYLASHRG